MSEQVLNAILGGLEEMKKELAEIKQKQASQEEVLEKLAFANEMQNVKLENIQTKLDNLVEASIRKNSFFYWNFLPPELKAHCVEQMDFKTKTGLRCSSKTEMRLVDSLKPSFNKVQIWIRDKFDVWMDEDKKITCTIPFYECYWEDMDPLELSKSEEKFESFMRFMKKQAPNLKVKELQVPLEPVFAVGLEIIKSCSMDTLTEITISELDKKEHLEELLRLPQVLNVPKLSIYSSKRMLVKGIFTSLLERWLVDDSPVGKQLLIATWPDFTCDEFLEHLNLKIVHHQKNYTKHAILLETDDPSKHIWIHSDPISHFIAVRIVTTGSEEPDFEKMRNDFRKE